MTQITIIQHPVLSYMLSQLRDPATSNFEFSRLLHDVTSLLTYEVARDWGARGHAAGATERIANPPSLVVLMRAGNGMIDGARSVLRGAPVGHIGIYRDKTMGCTVEYFLKIPEGSAANGVILLDPVIGTAASVIAGIKRLEQLDIEDITVVTILGSHEGVARLREACPKVRVFALDISDDLSEEGLLEPGMGDVSARMYNYA